MICYFFQLLKLSIIPTVPVSTTAPTNKYMYILQYMDIYKNVFSQDPDCSNRASDNDCAYWASIGECVKAESKEWMETNCARACSACDKPESECLRSNL